MGRHTEMGGEGVWAGGKGVGRHTESGGEGVWAGGKGVGRHTESVGVRGCGQEGRGWEDTLKVGVMGWG